MGLYTTCINLSFGRLFTIFTKQDLETNAWASTSYCLNHVEYSTPKPLAHRVSVQVVVGRAQRKRYFRVDVWNASFYVPHLNFFNTGASFHLTI